MAAKAVVAPIVTADAGFWERFQRLANSRISESNIISGERLWELELASSADQVPRLRIRSTRYDTDYIECCLDFESQILLCQPGPAITDSPLIFQLLGGPGDELRRNGVECTLDQAVISVLDRLVWFEDGDCTIADAPDSEGR